jgi:hypothetical protein
MCGSASPPSTVVLSAPTSAALGSFSSVVWRREKGGANGDGRQHQEPAAGWHRITGASPVPPATAAATSPMIPGCCLTVPRWMQTNRPTLAEKGRRAGGERGWCDRVRLHEKEVALGRGWHVARCKSLSLAFFPTKKRGSMRSFFFSSLGHTKNRYRGELWYRSSTHALACSQYGAITRSN